MTTAEKPLLVWDVDDVLNSLMRIYVERGLPDGARRIPYAGITVNPPHELLEITRDEYLVSLDRVRAAGFYDLPPRSEVSEFFAEYGSRFDHAVLSAVPMRFMPDSAAWVLHHFGRWIQNLFFIPSPRPEQKTASQLFATKAEAMAFLGRRAVLIDDSPANVGAVAKAGGRARLFPAPWNEGAKMSAEYFLKELSAI